MKETEQERKRSFFEEATAFMKRYLPVDKSFDVIERVVEVGGRATHLYFIDGFIKDELMQRILTDFFKTAPADMDNMPAAGDFSRLKIPYVEVALEPEPKKAADAVLSGQTAMLIQGYEEVILMDLRTYPTRGVEEPEKEKTLRGSRDGLVETIVFNTALIRRRVRDSALIFDMHSVGKVSRTDVCIGYMEGLVDEKLVKQLKEQLSKLDMKSLTVGDQSLVEALGSLQQGRKRNRSAGRFWNPFPKVRYTERPDVVAAHLTEGKFVILVDNSPTAMILPTGLFDFLQDVDDYYFPIVTGNYFRFIRNITMLVTAFITPVYLMIAMGDIPLPDGLLFILPQEAYNIPLFWQFLLLELAVDGLKLASLNTPSALGMSLSVIGALILGDFSVTAGWFIPQSILLMATVALAGFSQPSIELNYAIKFMRMGMLVGVAAGGSLGFAAAVLLELVMLCTTKTITGTSYLYPLIPWNWTKLKGLIFRTR